MARLYQSDEQFCFERAERNHRRVASDQMFCAAQSQRRVRHEVACRNRQILNPWPPAAVAEINEGDTTIGQQ